MWDGKDVRFLTWDELSTGCQVEDAVFGQLQAFMEQKSAELRPLSRELPSSLLVLAGLLEEVRRRHEMLQLHASMVEQRIDWRKDVRKVQRYLDSGNNPMYGPPPDKHADELLIPDSLAQYLDEEELRRFDQANMERAVSRTLSDEWTLLLDAPDEASSADRLPRFYQAFQAHHLISDWDAIAETNPAPKLLGAYIRSIRKVIGVLDSFANRLNQLIVTCDESKERRGHDEPDDLKAVNRLVGWSEILDAVGRPDDFKEALRRLNEAFDGPIKIRQGASPMVERTLLIKWWNSLDQRVAASEKKRADQKAAVSESSTFEFGCEGAVVAPEIGGEVKKRRRRTGNGAE